MRYFLAAAVLAGASPAFGACGDDPNASSKPTSVRPVLSAAPPPRRVVSTKPVVQLPCDPSVGSPAPKASCPDAEPETGWVTVVGGELLLTGFRTLHSNAEGRAYAEKHGTEFPFPNDYLDAPTGESRTLTLAPGTTCTGAILVGYEEPLADHVVPCEELASVARSRQVPAAVWSAEGAIVQLSELYRP